MVTVRHTLAVLVLVVGSVVTCLAQPRFTAATVARPGQVRTYVRIDTTGIRPGPSGPNVQWFFAPPQPGVGTSQMTVLPPSRLAASIRQRFPATQFAIVHDSTTSLYAITNGLYRCIGIVTPGTLTTFFAEEGSHDSRPVEFTSGQIYRDTFRGTLTTTGVMGTGTRSGTVETQYDAYGSLQVGDDVIFRNAMRLKTTTIMLDTVRSSSENLTTRTVTISWAWYDGTNGLPLVELRTDSIRSFRGQTPIGPVSVQRRYYVIDTSGIPTSVDERPDLGSRRGGFEVRSGQRITIHDLPLGTTTATIVDNGGRAVAGPILDGHTIVVPSLPPGFYVVVVEGIGGSSSSLPIMVVGP